MEHEGKHEDNRSLVLLRHQKKFSSEHQPRPENRSGGRNPITRALKKALGQVDPKTGRPVVELYAEAVVNQAVRGNSQALKEVNARVDGPLPERVAGDPPIDLSGWSLADKKALLELLKRNARHDQPPVD